MTAPLPARWSDILGLGGPSEAWLRISVWVRASKPGPSRDYLAPYEPPPRSYRKAAAPKEAHQTRWKTSPVWREYLVAAEEHIQRFGCVSAAALGRARGETNKHGAARANAIARVARAMMPDGPTFMVKTDRCWSVFYGPRGLVEMYYAACGLEVAAVEEHRAKTH